jgi:CRISPR-associated endonuclease/helicase Cas3
MKTKHFAHVRKSDGEEQSVAEHLSAVAELSKQFAAKIGMDPAGELIGLVHDLGKYSQTFQNYLLSALGRLNPDADDDYVDFKDFKGKIDHSTSGAQLIWQRLESEGELKRIVGQILAICVASHHSGLIDCVGGSDERFGHDVFSTRMAKADEKTHLSEAESKMPEQLIQRVAEILKDQTLVSSIGERITRLVQEAPQKHHQSVVVQVQLSLLVRLLFSCLIDADRVDTADFEYPFGRNIRKLGVYKEWALLIDRFEEFIGKFEADSDINKIRQKISNECFARADSNRGTFSLSVPTGGGKTLASLRFGLHHANKHEMDRIIFVIPYTSIIDQNAKQVREILEVKGESIVLEHHSNLAPEKVGFREKVLSENWDVPIVFTTMVQFLETLFGSGTRAPRRMHQLANSVIVFDEIQSLPINCVHLFNNAVNFLVEQCKSTVVLCTATQPLLNQVDVDKGNLKLEHKNEIMSSADTLYENLRRVKVIDRQKPEEWQDAEIAELAIASTKASGSCLFVANTKASARAVFDQVSEQLGESSSREAFHLSTSMCPVHRKLVLDQVKQRLEDELPVICVSTQLIEAGVDVDFGAAIRACAGLDSIAQTAGRCNRNATQGVGEVYIVNPASENLNSLLEIRVARDITQRVLNDFADDPAKFDNDLIGTAAMKWYFENYFHRRADEMSYNVHKSQIGHDDTILNLLGKNKLSVGEFKNRQNEAPSVFLRQAFMTASKAFKVIDAPTRGVVIPFQSEGKALVTALMAAEYDHEIKPLLRQAQQYTVNVFPDTLIKLDHRRAIFKIASDIEIYCLDGQFYDSQFGLADEPVSQMEFLNA